jgi:hypothetical protein
MLIELAPFSVSQPFGAGCKVQILVECIAPLNGLVNNVSSSFFFDLFLLVTSGLHTIEDGTSLGWRFLFSMFLIFSDSKRLVCQKKGVCVTYKVLK